MVDVYIVNRDNCVRLSWPKIIKTTANSRWQELHVAMPKAIFMLDKSWVFLKGIFTNKN